jgi:effector-binding domain-containing protein
LPAEEAAATTHIGPYEGLNAAYEEIGAWTARQGRELGDAMYEEYWSDPQSEPSSEWRTTVVWPLKE